MRYPSLGFASRIALALVVASCGGQPGPAGAKSAPPDTGRAEPTAPPTLGAAGETSSAPKPAPDGAASGKRLTVEQGRKYMVELINRDRRSLGLTPVELDLGPPTAAGQAHAEDMATHAYLGHWGSDGSVPEQRLTDAGGADLVLENASCYFDERARTLDPKPTILASEIERTEAMFFNEVPPNDGHRKNILRPTHRRVGVGIAQPVSTATEIAVPCFSQEFVDAYGTYAPLPRKAKVGQMIHVEGAVGSPAQVMGVGLARLNVPKPLSVPELNRRRSYTIPSAFQMYWPKGYKTPIPLAVVDGRFSIDVPLSEHGEPGLYEVSVWGKFPGAADPVMVGLRTILVEK